jgi:hypothetical protein
MRSCLERIFKDDISDSQWMQAGFGGLRLTYTERRFSAAFIGSAKISSGVVSDQDTLWALTPLSTLHEITTMPNCFPITSPLRPSPASSQASITLPLLQGTRAALLAVSDLRNKAHLQYLSLSQAYAWILSVQYKPSLQLKPAELRQAT